MQSRLADTARDHPVPLALVGLGLGWMLVRGLRSRTSGASVGSSRGNYGSDYEGAQEGLGYGRASSPDPDYAGYGASSAGSGFTDQARDYAQTATNRTRQWGERASETASRVSQRAQEFAHDARERVSQAGRSARVQASQMADRSVQTLQDHPIMLGSVALLVGAAIGASLPRTRGEDSLLGEASDEMTRRAREGGYVEKIKRVGERAVDATREAAGEAFQRVRTAASDEAARQDLPGTTRH
jgi:ElaB/YqjD/DUF883 family membrane-anchored ribosome-binding protein